MAEQGNVTFEKNCLAVFEKLLQGYKRAKESNVWESNIEELLDKMTQFPTEPFSTKLMDMFDYDYLVKAESIESIIEKSLIIREQLKDTERFVTVSEKYFSLPFLPSNTYLKKLEIFNSKGELCYTQKGRMRINIIRLFIWIFLREKAKKTQDIISIQHKSSEIKLLEIYYYSEYINLSTTDPKAYYKFFCDYYGKLKFLNYIRANNNIPIEVTEPTSVKTISELSSIRQVLWAKFIFNLVGLRLRENLDTSSLAKFLLLINNMNLEDYKNSYFYKIAGKLQNLSSKKYYRELEYVRTYFQERKIPTKDIDNELEKLKR